MNKTTNAFTFASTSGWIVCRSARGARSIVMRDDLHCDHLVTKRGACHIGAKADSWLAAHDHTREDLAAWLAARREALAAWKHETPHHRYDCDRGALAIRVNGARVLVGNQCGDGNFPVYMIPDSGNLNADKPAPDALPHTFKFTGVSFDECELEIMSYDCDGAGVLETLKVESAYVYADGAGAMVVRYSEKEAV